MLLMLSRAVAAADNNDNDDDDDDDDDNDDDDDDNGIGVAFVKLKRLFYACYKLSIIHFISALDYAFRRIMWFASSLCMCSSFS